jgi:GT2 family glycosyltransferase
MLSVLQQSEVLRCYGLLNGSQGRVLIQGRLRRRLVRITPHTRSLCFELQGINGSVKLPILRLTPQPRWRVTRLLRRKLRNLHPSYSHRTTRSSLLRLWRDYNRLLARRSWPLVGYDEWLEYWERPWLENERHRSLPLSSPASNPQHLRFSLHVWGEKNSDAVHISLRSLCDQLPGPFHLLEPGMAPEPEDQATWIFWLQAGDRLAPQALRRAALAIARHPSVLVLYADEDRISTTGRRHSPQFKPAWNPDLLLSDPHYSHCWLIRADLAAQTLRALEIASEAFHPHTLALEATAACEAQQILHLPEVLYHRAEQSNERRGDASSAARVARFLARRGQIVPVTARATGGHRLHWPLPPSAPMVSILIPTRDRIGLLRGCLESLQRTVGDRLSLEFLIVDNGSCEPDSLAYLAELERRPDFTVLRRPGPFNYAALNNEAAALAKGQVLALLNNDVEALQPGWLEEMVAAALRPEIGAVGARLLFEDGSVQHAGVLLGIGGVAGHAHKYLQANEPGYQLRLQLTHQLSAVTGAVLVLRRELFLEVGGFDAATFAVNYNDVDLCLRLMASGYRNLYCSDAVLIHHESRSRGAPSTPEALSQWQRERQAMIDRWGDLLAADPHYSPHLSQVEENFSLALPKQMPQPRAGGWSHA